MKTVVFFATFGNFGKAVCPKMLYAKQWFVSRKSNKREQLDSFYAIKKKKTCDTLPLST
jgi:hypothetical protein